MNDISQWYGILGVNIADSPKVIKAAYRELAQLWHPDRYVDDPELKARAEEEIKEINQAYSEIKVYLAAKINGTLDTEAKDNHHSKINKVKTSPDFYYQQGVTLAEERQYDDALTSFAQAIKFNADYLEAYQYRGFILSKLGFNLRADAEFKKAHQIKLKNKFDRFQSKQYDHNDNIESCQQYSTDGEKASLPLKCWQSIAANQSLTDLAIIQDTYLAGVGEDREIQLWQIKDGQPLGTLKGHSDRVSCLTLSPSGETLISGSKDLTIRFWDLKTGKARRTFGGGFDAHAREITNLAVSPDNRILLSCDLDNSLKIWDINNASVIKNIFLPADLTCLEISPNGQLFCSGGLESQIRIRQIKDGQVVRLVKHDSEVLSVAFSPDGKLLAAGGSDRAIEVWDIATEKKVISLVGHAKRISKVIFSNDSKTLISGGWDGKIKLWELATGRETISLNAHAAEIDTMAIASNNRTLISSSDRLVKFWQCNF